MKEAVVDDLLDRMANRGVAASISADRTQVAVTISLELAEATTPSEAAGVGEGELLEAAAHLGILGLQPVALEAMTFSEHDERLAEPAIPELVGVTEIAQLLGVSRQRASDLRQRTGFPAPVTLLAAGPIWTRSSIGNFEAAWQRKPGRPARKSSS